MLNSHGGPRRFEANGAHWRLKTPEMLLKCAASCQLCCDSAGVTNALMAVFYRAVFLLFQD